MVEMLLAPIFFLTLTIYLIFLLKRSHQHKKAYGLAICLSFVLFIYFIIGVFSFFIPSTPSNT
ncbi:hypothetical protein LCL95_07990 [Bacillus timonensis]|nr:hypothetical protein [Bacillus timonensis]